jgi:hypothetical protein
MHPLAESDVVLNHRRGVYDAPLTDLGPGLHHAGGKQLRTIVNARERRHYCGRMAYIHEPPATCLQALLHG